MAGMPEIARNNFWIFFDKLHVCACNFTCAAVQQVTSVQPSAPRTWDKGSGVSFSYRRFWFLCVYAWERCNGSRSSSPFYVNVDHRSTTGWVRFTVNMRMLPLGTVITCSTVLYTVIRYCMITEVWLDTVKYAVQYCTMYDLISGISIRGGCLHINIYLYIFYM